jgi:hypothetical protein
MPSQPISIPYTAYAHIFESILDACDAPALRLFRPTSHSVRDMVDERIFAHVALTAELLDTSSPANLHPPEQEAWDGRGRAGVTLRSPSPPFALLPFTPRQVRVERGGFMWERVVQGVSRWPRVQILDMYGLPPSSEVQLPGLKCVCSAGAGPHLVSAPCVVRYYSQPPLTLWDQGPQQNVPSNRPITLASDVVMIDAPTVVMHASCAAAGSSRGQPPQWGVAPGPRTEEIIYVLPNPSDIGTAPAIPPSHTTCPHNYNLLLLNLNGSLCRVLRQGRVRLRIIEPEGPEGHLAGWARLYLLTWLGRNVGAAIGAQLEWLTTSEWTQADIPAPAREPALPMPDEVWRSVPLHPVLRLHTC